MSEPSKNNRHHLTNILLRVYDGGRYLATAKHDSSMSHIDNINNSNVVVTRTEDANVLNNVKIVAIDTFNHQLFTEWTRHNTYSRR